MTHNTMIDKAETYLQTLCTDIASRRVGGEGNRAATDFFAETVRCFGFDIETPTFACIDWVHQGADLVVDDETSWDVSVSPYSLGCSVQAPLTVVSTLASLEDADITQTMVLLCGEIAQEPLMPKHFPFYNPERHQRIVHLLESKRPQAIIAATSQHPELAGAVYPFPLLEDGDFDIPSVYMKDTMGARLAEHAGSIASLDIRAQRIPSEGYNVIARKGPDARRKVVVFAHIDAKEGTPGALDNAGGTAVLLLLAELLTHYEGDLGLEIVALNGEDYYSNPGQQQFLRRHQTAFEDILLGINLDGIGYHQGTSAYSCYNLPSDLADLAAQAFAAYPDLAEGDPWYQGDHSILLMNERPAIALTSERIFALLTDVVHTPKDRPEIVATERLVNAAYALRDLLVKIEP
jgi:aminopeptidase YwaD